MVAPSKILKFCVGLLAVSSNTDAAPARLDCNKINYNAGNDGGVYANKASVLACAPNGRHESRPCYDPSFQLDMWRCSVTTVHERHDDCARTSLNAGRKGKYENVNDLNRCAPKDGNLYKSKDGYEKLDNRKPEKTKTTKETPNKWQWNMDRVIGG